jgi:hypothetical protein
VKGQTLVVRLWEALEIYFSKCTLLWLLTLVEPSMPFSCSLMRCSRTWLLRDGETGADFLAGEGGIDILDACSKASLNKFDILRSQSHWF